MKWFILVFRFIWQFFQYIQFLLRLPFFPHIYIRLLLLHLLYHLLLPTGLMFLILYKTKEIYHKRNEIVILRKKLQELQTVESSDVTLAKYRGIVPAHSVLLTHSDKKEV